MFASQHSETQFTPMRMLLLSSDLKRKNNHNPYKTPRYYKTRNYNNQAFPKLAANTVKKQHLTWQDIFSGNKSKANVV